MDPNLKAFLESGKALLSDTTARKPKSESVKAPKKGPDVPLSSDPHKVLIKRCIEDKISKKDIVEEIKKFIEQAENDM